MNAERLLAQYEQVADAPDAVARLRRFILDLAVRGKLVTQDVRDEPASELLKRIAAEKQRLVKVGEMDKQKPLLPIGEDADFAIPSSWCWTRLGAIASYIQRGKSPKYATSDGALVVSQRCVQWRGLDLAVAKQVTLDSLADYEQVRFLRSGDLLWNSTGTGTIGRVVRLVDPPDKLVCDSHVTVVRCLECDPEYIRTWLRSDHVYALIEDRAAGSTNQVELTAQMAINQVVPLPPLAEQHRIVAKVDELMALCDRLEAARQAREAARDRLALASLNRLNAPDSETFQAAARFALDALPALTTRPDQIKQLRQAILNLAVRGRLVRQDPNDEPAAQLLKRVAGEITAYGKANRIGQTQVEPISDADLPFSVPNGWQWTRLCALFKVITDGDHQPPPKADKGVAFLTIGNVTTGQLDFTDCRLVPETYFKSLAPYRTPAKGDILYTVVGATYGRPALVDTERDFCVQRHIAILKPAAAMSLRFLMALLASPFIYDQAKRSTTGTAQPTIALRPLRNFIAPLPPLAEQHRIVAKVDALMALCDRLEANLISAAATRRRLLDALFAEALAPTEDRELQAAE
ncbi:MULTISPECIES: restriction endonuclease subunit S [unclassified Bradyrhizobium]|uniref:restriction endonuclease subunit S n=1 Tax=unclassified Bradyrhizobium TaxID=2631580 RepID=UPI00211EBAAD|nr:MULTISPECIES: restriction endonuclease subunit S [unclassified Bradyrhizobium]MDD1536676.1 restriction endonuclease [Bradyrhizobium sp. WBOS8]MDD1587101.1 restriction endonuclease [Bradyrhizobium sp. WBOS4]UUO45989.1 restriction endonuclease [Bradyrhizobium sp. WBOS04]UUO59693.1 restriction endonuclease [Bradyrhizobium sp. WBOS08]